MGICRHEYHPGIGSGIASAAKGLVQIAVNAARNAIYAVKSWLGIASPSKRAKKEIGQWILPGVGEGVKESEPELNDRMEDAADHMVSAFNGHSRNIDVSGLVRKMQAGVEQETAKINNTVTIKSKTGSGRSLRPPVKPWIMTVWVMLWQKALTGQA